MIAVSNENAMSRGLATKCDVIDLNAEVQALTEQAAVGASILRAMAPLKAVAIRQLNKAFSHSAVFGGM